MKKILFLTSILTMVVFSCNEEDDFLEVAPQGSLDFSALTTPDGIDGLLIAAYSAIDGVTAPAGVIGNAWRIGASNWVYGDVASDDAFKGTDIGDQLPINDIERMEHNAANDYFDSKWRAVYDGVARANDVLRALEEATELDQGFVTLKTAEARFLRGWFHLEARKFWRNIPFIDETVAEFRMANTEDVFPLIEADFQFAIDNLPDKPDVAEVGRANRQKAQAALAKAYLFEQNMDAARPLLDEIINSGIYALHPNYNELFRAATDVNDETIFSAQSSVNDGASTGRGSENGNIGNILNFPHSGSPFGCCGFHQPTWNLVNAYQTENGLPLLDTFNDQDVTNDQGIPSSEPFTEHQGPLDPRLDWTVGRRGIPYLGWGDHEGAVWIRDQAFGGPYSPKKHVFSADESGSQSSTSGWTANTTSINQHLIRYADVLLWRAEIAVEDGDLAMARDLVNQVRARARDGEPVRDPDGSPAANYVVDEYPAGHPAFASQAEARKAVRFERRLEFAMEGHRFFDLVRWGIAKEVLDEFYAEESIPSKKPFLSGATFTEGRNELYPIPLNQIIDSSIGGQATLVQNPGY